MLLKSRTRSFLAAIAAIGLATLFDENAAAQTNSLFGDRGPASQIGSNLTGSTVGQGSTFGTTSTTLGLSGQPLTGSGPAGQGTGGAGFVGRDDNAGRFVGEQRVGQQAQAGGQSRFGGFSGRDRSESRSRFGNQSRTGNRQKLRVIRPRQKIAFSFPQRPAAEIDRSLELRMTRLMSSEPRRGAVNIAVNPQGVAILTGTVDSPEAKRLAAIMARLEPGVREVDNQLAVAEAAKSPAQ